MAEVIGMLDLGPRLAYNGFVAAEDGPESSELARLWEQAPGGFTHCFVYAVTSGTAPDPTVFRLVDRMGDDCWLVQVRSPELTGVAMPGRSLYTKSVHDAYSGEFFHLTDVTAYALIGQHNAKLCQDGASRVVLATQFAPNLRGIEIPSPGLIKERFDTWDKRAEYDATFV